MPNLKGWEILIILALILLLFGAKRLPDAARGLGRSLRIFKAETKGLRDDEADENPPARDGYVAPRALPLGDDEREPLPPRQTEQRTTDR